MITRWKKVDRNKLFFEKDKTYVLFWAADTNTHVKVNTNLSRRLLVESRFHPQLEAKNKYHESILFLIVLTPYPSSMLKVLMLPYLNC